MSQEKFVSSREGATLLEIDRQSFFYYAESRNVQRREVNDGGKERYEYSYDDLLGIKDEIQERRANKKHKYGDKTAKNNVKGITDWGVREDLPYIYALDCDTYGIEYSVPASRTLQWWQKNQAAIRVLFNSENRKDIWGCLTLLPMEEEIIFDLLRGDMSEQEIEAKHILAYEPGQAYSCYIASCVVRSDKMKFFNQLFNSITDYWCDHPEIHICKLYGFVLGVSTDALKTEENDGLRMVKKLYFSPRYDLGNNAWELDLDRYNPSIAIQRFQACIRKKRKEEQS